MATPEEEIDTATETYHPLPPLHTASATLLIFFCRPSPLSRRPDATVLRFGVEGDDTAEAPATEAVKSPVKAKSS